MLGAPSGKSSSGGLECSEPKLDASEHASVETSVLDAQPGQNLSNPISASVSTGDCGAAGQESSSERSSMMSASCSFFTTGAMHIGGMLVTKVGTSGKPTT